VRVPWKVVKLTLLEGQRFHVRFRDGVEGEVDLTEFLKRDDAEIGVFCALRDPDVFRRARLLYGAVTWPGRVDLAPDNMYRLIKKHGEYRL